MPLIRHIRSFAARLAARARDERGLAMVVVTGAMVVVMGASAVALAAAGGDLRLGKQDEDTKRAYAAAEAGIADYLFHLNQDNAHWAKCTGVSLPAVVNQVWNGVGTDPRKWRPLSGSNASYAIELLPANGFTQCDPLKAAQSMIDAATGTFRIRATGRVLTGDGREVKRSVVTTFKRRGFLDYLYYTDYETSDPAWYELDTRGRQTDPDLVAWASQRCASYYRDGRGDQRYFDKDGDGPDDGRIFWFDNQWHSWSDSCTEIQFASGDKVKGPLHTNDSLLVCGTPEFGRGPNDKVEVSGPSPGWRGSSSCASNSPTFTGTFRADAPAIGMPPSNTRLKKIALPGYTFTGRTEITLSGALMLVKNAAFGSVPRSMPLPPNGVVYVQNGSCGQGYRPLAPYSAPTGCADVYVKGNYALDLTIASEKDIIVWGSVTKTALADSVLGLIANNFVRVYHPVKSLSVSSSVTCTNDTGTMQNVQIDAAILSLQHSFTVDNYFCGAALGTLTVNGVIAQKFRGPVGRGGSTIVNGYLKNYNYDDRLSLRSPPHFLDPVQSAWKIQRQTEQTPPR